MIFSFRSKETEAIWRGDFVKGLPPDFQNLARRKMRMLNSAKSLEDLQPLQSEREGRHSVVINDQLRLCFLWSGRGAKEVEIAE